MQPKYSLIERLNVVPLDEQVTFKGTLEFYYSENNLKCNLDGEFLNNGQSFKPPLQYSLVNMGVTTAIPEILLREMYSYLISPKKKQP